MGNPGTIYVRASERAPPVIDIRKADDAVEQGAEDQHLPAGHRIALARDLEMTDHGLFADAEDAGGLAGGLAARRPEHAFALPLGQRRPQNGQASCRASVRQYV